MNIQAVSYLLCLFICFCFLTNVVVSAVFATEHSGSRLV